MAPRDKLDINPDAFLQYSAAAVAGGLLENLVISSLSVPLFLGFGSLAGAIAVYVYYHHVDNGWMCSGMHMFAAAVFPVFSLVFGVLTKIIEIYVK
jgi:hypothetical protein